MDGLTQPQTDGSSAVKMTDALPNPASLDKRKFSPSQTVAGCKADRETKVQLVLKSNVVAAQLCSEPEMRDMEAETKKADRKKVRQYLKSLLDFNHEASKSTASYAATSPRLKQYVTSFKTINGTNQTVKYCKFVTAVCFKLLNTFQEYEPDYVYDLYIYWEQILSSFSSKDRAETFIDYFQRFELVVEHLKLARNRWTQWIVLSIVQHYTKDVTSQTIYALSRNNGCLFLHIVEEIMDLPTDRKASIEPINALITTINSKNHSVQSFQPYKVMCSGEEYTLVDFDLWMDWNSRRKVISFLVMSKTTVQKHICGFTWSMGHTEIESRQNDLFVQSKWALASAKNKPKKDEIEVQFCFSARTHSVILGSDLRKYFKNDKVTAPGDNGSTINQLPKGTKTLPTIVEPKKEIPDGQDQPLSIIEVNVDVREKSMQNQPQRTIETTAVKDEGSQEIQRIPATSKVQSINVVVSTVKTSDYFAQSSGCHEKAVGASRSKKPFSKRRNDQIYDKDSSTDVRNMKPNGKRIRTDDALNNGLSAKQISSTIAQPLTSEQEHPSVINIIQCPRPQAVKATAIKVENAQSLVGLNQTATDTELSEATSGQYAEDNYEKSRAEELKRSQAANMSLTAFMQDFSLQGNQRFSSRTWSRTWAIRNFYAKGLFEPPHNSGDEDQNWQNEFDEMDADVHSESVSNPLRPLKL